MKALRLLKALMVSGALGCGMGCTHHFFKAEGTIGSEGKGPLGTWRSAPEGCSRDPVVAPEGLQGKTVATMLWDDMITRDEFAVQHTRNRKSLPARLDLWRTETGVVGQMETQRPAAVMALDRSVCRQLEMTASEGRPSIKGGRPTLGGVITLDCEGGGNHLSGRVEFSGCEY